MKKSLMLAIILVWILAVQLGLIGISEGQVAENPQGDLWGENTGDQIVFTWDEQEGTSEYIVYRARHVKGPWEELARIREVAASTGGAKVDVTPDARKRDLCYKVEAIDTNGQIIRTYQPMCVPKFAQ